MATSSRHGRQVPSSRRPGQADASVTKGKKVILQDKVHLMIGGLLASTGYALAPVSTARRRSTCRRCRPRTTWTQRQLEKYPYFLRTSWTSSLPHHPLGQWACDNGFKKVITIAADYAFGYEVVGGFQKAFEDCGGKVVQKIWATARTKDFGPYIPTFKADADAVFTVMVGRWRCNSPSSCAAPASRSRSWAQASAMTNSCCPSWATK